MFDSQLYPLRDNNGRCVNQEGKHELHMIINFGQVNTSYLSSFTAINNITKQGRNTRNLTNNGSNNKQ